MTGEKREEVLRNTVLNAAYLGLSNIDAESRARNNARKDYNATFLGYVMKRFGDRWLIVSMGIGDGIIGLLGRDGHAELLSEPDGGEYVGQTRFITMNEVWKNAPINRVRAFRVPDFDVIMSMTDGVSDPKFETDNNLKDGKLWLDFYANGNHDDRTLVLVY